MWSERADLTPRVWGLLIPLWCVVLVRRGRGAAINRNPQSSFAKITGGCCVTYCSSCARENSSKVWCKCQEHFSFCIYLVLQQSSFFFACDWGFVFASSHEQLLLWSNLGVIFSETGASALDVNSKAVKTNFSRRYRIIIGLRVCNFLKSKPIALFSVSPRVSRYLRPRRFTSTKSSSTRAALVCSHRRLINLHYWPKEP